MLVKYDRLFKDIIYLKIKQAFKQLIISFEMDFCVKNLFVFSI